MHAKDVYVCKKDEREGGREREGRGREREREREKERERDVNL